MLRPSHNHGTHRLPNDDDDIVTTQCMFTLSVMCVVCTHKEICVSQHVSINTVCIYNILFYFVSYFSNYICI